MENFKKYWRVWLIVVVVVFLYLRNKDGSSYVPPVEGADYISGCEKMVLGRIKSPSAAIFSDVVYVEGNASVDSKIQYNILWKLDSDMTVTIAE